MANPQLENGHTKIANELLKALFRAPISGRELRVMLAIIRFSYGFHDKSSAMTHRFLSDQTGIDRSDVSKAIRNLSKKNMLVVSGDGYKREYGPQKNYESWYFGGDLTPKKIGGGLTPNWGRFDPKFGGGLTPPSFKENIKKTLKENTLGKNGEIGGKTAPKSSGNNKPKCPFSKIIDLYHETLPGLPRIRVQGKTLKSRMSARWSESAERRNIEWWKKYFTQVSESDFLMGRKTDWRATLDWLSGPQNMEKVLNGNYENTSAPNKNPYYMTGEDRKNEFRKFREELRTVDEPHGENIKNRTNENSL